MSTGSYKQPPEKGRGKFPGPVTIILSTAAVFFISQIAAIFLVEIGLQLFGETTNLLDSAVAQFFLVLLTEVLAIWLILQLLKRRGLTFKDIGLGRRPKWRDAGMALAVFIAFYIGAAIVFSLLVSVFPDLQTKLDTPQDVGFQNLGSDLDKLLAFVSLVIFAPIGEEIAVRGYLYSGLRSRWKFLPAATATAIVFGAAHLQPGNAAGLVWGAALTTFILSYALVYLRERTGALYASMLVHAANNLVAFAVYFTALSF